MKREDILVPITKSLIIINFVIFLLLSQLNNKNAQLWLDMFGFTPYWWNMHMVDGIQWYTYCTIITHMFMHISVDHIFFNLLFLWIVGSWIELVIGKWNFILLYFIGGLVAVNVYALMMPSFTVSPMIGASGCITALMGAYVFIAPSIELFKKSSIHIVTCMLIITWMCYELYNITYISYDIEKGVAHWAHVGGISVGLTYGLGWKLINRKNGIAVLNTKRL